MSGDLKDPRKSIPKGTIAAILVSLAIYVGLAYWLARSATPEQLVSNYTIMIDEAAWGPAVVAGLLGATFSSALASLVGAPRILEALGVHRILPAGEWVSQRSESGEPTRALLISGILVAGALMLRSLNAVAPLITMFFLITYAMINVVVLVEQRLNLVSFRPLLRIHWSIPLFGALGCVGAMFIIAPAFGLAAVVLVVGLYAYLVSRNLTPPYGDVRSGLFYGVSEWAAKHVSALGGAQDRAWKPNLLVPADDEGDIRRNYHFLRNLAHPKGMLRLLGVADPGGSADLAEPLENLRHAFSEEGLFVRSSTIESASYADGVSGALQALRATLFRPNVLFLPFPHTSDDRPVVEHLTDEARRNGLGSLVFREHDRTGLGRRSRINVWLPRPKAGWSIDLEELGDMDLALLTAVKLQQNWKADVRLVAALDDPDEEEAARTFLTALSSLARLPGSVVPVEASLPDDLDEAPEADLQVIPLGEDPDWDALDAAAERARSSVVFTRDGGDENALA